MRNSRALLLATAIMLVLTSCSEPSTPAYQKHLRPFGASDGPLLGLNESQALERQVSDHSYVATTDIKLQPVCDSERRLIVVAKAAGVGQWLGGDPGCEVIEMSVQNRTNVAAFNPYCAWSKERIEGDCTKLLSRKPPPAGMMSRLQPASYEEVYQALAPGIDGEPSLLPPPDEMKRFYIVKPDSDNKPLVITPLFGQEAISILLPDGVKLGGGRLGHNRIYIGPSPSGDPLCNAVRQYGLDALPIKFSGPELAYVQACQT